MGALSGDASTGIEETTTSIENLSESSNTLLSQLNAVNSILSSQSTGKSISIADFNSDELKDYQSALEYVNGSMQLNTEKVRELTKAKAEEQIATNDANKVQQQSQYMKNIAEIEKLQDELRGLTDAKDENADAIRSSIDALLSENDSIVNQCSQLDILSASLREATGAYENWLSKQNTAESGDMFDDSLGAMQAIDDVSDKESDDYGRIGTNKYKAAVELVIPDTVDAENQEAVQSYMDSIASYFTYDKDGNRAGLNIEEFCQRAMDKGLMVLDESGKNYEVAGQRTMEDFAEGLNLSMPVVQAMFGEMEEFGGKFTWADEAIQTLGDMGMAAGEAKSRLEEISGDENNIQIDVSDLDNAEDKISVLDNTILQMQGLKARPDIDPSSIEDANAIIQYCVTQKQMLEAPVVMSVNADNVSGELSTAVSLLQQFQEAQNNVALQAAIGADTSEAEGKVQELTGEIQGLSPEIQAKLNIDATSTDTIIASIQGMTPEVLVHAGIDASEVEAYQKSEHDSQGTVQWDNDTGIVDAWASQMHTSMGTVTWKNDITAVKTQFSAEGIVNWSNTTPPSSGTNGLNGTAHAKGTVYPHLVGHAHAKGNWGTKTGGVSLVGELGPEILVHPSGFWEEIGANGAEFRYIPKNSIIFNHLQTESLLEQGFVNSRGHAYLSGTALVRGAISVSQANKRPKGTYTYSPKNSSVSSNSGNSNIADTAKAAEDTKESIDWIDTALSRIERKVKNLKSIAENIYISFKKRNKNLTSEIKTIRKEIATQEKAAKRYKKEARAVDLSSSLKKLVQNGTIDIRKYDEDTQKKIQEYQTWYEKMLSCKDAVTELKDTITDLYRQKFDNIITKWSNALQNLEHQAERTEAAISNRTDEANERFTIDRATSASRLNISDYQSLVSNKQSQKSQKEAELTELRSNLEWAVKHPKTSGITKGSEGYYEMLADIQDIENEIDSLNGEIIDGANSVAEEYMKIFDNVATDFENKLSLSEHISNVYSNALDLATEQGYMASTKYYEMMSNIEKDNISVMTQELQSLKQAMKEGLESGYIKEGSQDWYDMREQINSVSESIDQATLKTEQFANSIRQIGWDRFDYLQDKISLITDEANFLIELMSNSDQFNDKGIVTDKGMATFGLHGQNYNVLMEQADDYAEQIRKINAEIANDPSDTKLIERKEELIRLQQESIKAAEDEKQAIKSLVKEGIDKQLDSLQDLIDKYEKALDSQKDIFDFQKNISDQVKNISALQKQLGIYEGDISEETQAKVQKLKVDLEKAQSDLEETQYDHFISDQKKLLDDLYDDYEKVLNERLDDIDALIKGVIDAVNNDAAKINETLSTVAADVGYATSEELKSIWGKDSSIYSVLETYHNALIGESGTFTTVAATLNNISVAVEKLVTDAEKNAEKVENKGAVENNTNVANTTQSDQSTTTPVVTSTPDTATTATSPGIQTTIAKTESGANIASEAAAPEDKILKIINSGKVHEKKVSAKEDKKHTNLWKYLVKKYGRDTDESIMKKLAKALGIKVSSGLTNAEKTPILKALKKKGYASGTPRVGKDEWNWTNEGWIDGNYETIIRKKDGAILTPCKTNDMVYGAFASKNMYDFAQNPRGYVGDLIAGLEVPQGINNIRSNVNNTGDTTVILNMDFPGVKNYSELVHCMQHDSKFEKYIQSISVDLLAGKSKNAKYNYRF